MIFYNLWQGANPACSCLRTFEFIYFFACEINVLTIGVIGLITGAASGSSSAHILTSGAGGRGERLSAVQKERMKMLTTAAFDRGKDEDTFGMNDEDWQLYKRMGKDSDDIEEADDEEAELARLTSRLQVCAIYPLRRLVGLVSVTADLVA